MNIEQYRFIFIKDYNENNLNIKKGTELRLFRGFVYLNGGMIVPAYKQILINLVKQEMVEPNYLEQIEILKDKV